jgi:hypothetical protein
VQCKPAVTDNNRMAGIGPSTVSDDHITVLGKDVHNLALAFVAPL